MKMEACQSFDIETLFGECDDSNQRTIEYRWIQPQLCNDKDPKSVSLPSNKTALCRRCNQGQYFDQLIKRCTFCPDGQYQPIDYHKNQSAPMPNQCLTCGKGVAAVKVLAYDDFE